MSSNLLKRNYANLTQDGARVIAVNDIMAKKLEALSVKREVPKDGFVSGLAADVIDTSEYMESGSEILGEAVLSEADEPAAQKLEAEAEAAKILERARAQAQEIEQTAQQERTRILEEAKRQGYAEGMEQAGKEAARKEAALLEKERLLEENYRNMEEELEPKFVDTITGIYEHIFQVELGKYRQVLGYLISATMRRAEGTREFLVHISGADYAEVSVMKQQIAQGCVSPNCSVEFVEDVTLSEGECLIETEGGIFDCGLGTQLTQLGQKLRLLSYEKH